MEANDFDLISHYCAEKASRWAAPPEIDSTMKENVESFDVNAIQELATKARAFAKSTQEESKYKKPSVPNKKHVFQDKKNSEGKRGVDSKKKKATSTKSLGTLLREKVAKSEATIEGLQQELRKKDEELDGMADFVSTLQDLLRRMASGNIATDQLDTLTRSPTVDVEALGEIALQMALREKENEIVALKEKATQLLATVSKQGIIIHSLEGIIGEKEQAIEEISHFNEMDTIANKKILAHVNEKHQEAMNGAQMRYVRGVHHLLENVAGQASLISDLKSLLYEKDEAIAEMTQYNDVNDMANEKLLAHANKKHKAELREQELLIKSMHSVLSLQLREKVTNQRELALIELRLLNEGDVTGQCVEEIKFILATLATLMVLMGLVWQKEWIFYGSPLYVAFLCCMLE